MGGIHFIQRVVSGNIIFVGDIAEKLKANLTEITSNLKAEDTTIKVCGNHFHVFFHKPTKYASGVFIDLFRFTAKNTMKEFNIGERLDDKYVFTGIYDLSEEWIRKDLKILGEAL